MTSKASPAPAGGISPIIGATPIIGGLVRKSAVVYPDDCTSPEARAAYEHALIQTRMAELVSDATRDGTTITKWYIDLDVSGRAEYAHKREGLQELLTDARAGRVTVLYAREMSRIYRDTVKSIVFKGEMKKWGVDIRARDMIRSDDTATETLVQTIQFAVDQFQSERTGIQIRSRNLQAFLAGQWPGMAHDMWGLRYNAASKGFDLDPVSADYVRRVMEMLVEERGNAYRVALTLNTARLSFAPDALETPGGKGAHWTARDVLRLADTPFYRRTGKYAKQTKYLPELIPEVVSPALMAEVDRVLGLRRDTLGGKRRYSSREDYTYGPLMRCGDCGCRMRTIRFLKYREAGNPNWLCWVCRAGSDSRVVCPHSWSFPQTRLDRLIVRGLTQAVAEAEVIARAAGQPNRGEPKRKPVPRKADTAGDRLAKIDAQKERTLRLYTSGVTSDLEWVQGEIARLETARTVALAEQEAPIDQAGAAPLTEGQQEALTAALADCWQAGPTESLDKAKRDLLMTLGVRFVVSVLPRTLPPAGRGTTPQGKRRADGAHTGGPLRVVMEIERLGRVGETALTVEETEQEWYERLCAGNKAAYQAKVAAKAKREAS